MGSYGQPGKTTRVSVTAVIGYRRARGGAGAGEAGRDQIREDLDCS